jgi:hypothetical protein
VVLGPLFKTRSEMEDRFKFRAYDIHCNEMRKVHILGHNNDGSIWVEFEDGTGIDNIELKYLMRSTGLKDKNGKLIFKGCFMEAE